MPSPIMPRSRSKIRRRHQPVADVIAENALAGARDFARQRRIPPHMIDVDRDAEPVAQFVAKIVGVAERRDTATVGGRHGMQRLHRQRHVGLPRVRQKRRKSVTHLLCARRQYLSSRAAILPAISNKIGSADADRFVERAAIVVDGGAASGFVSRRKQATPHKACDFQAGIANYLAGLRNADGLHEIAPRRDGGDPGARASIDQLLQVQRFDRGAVDRQRTVVVRKVAHQLAIPRVAITALMRAAALSGSASRPAASASRNSSAR